MRPPSHHHTLLRGGAHGPWWQQGPQSSSGVIIKQISLCSASAPTLHTSSACSQLPRKIPNPTDHLKEKGNTRFPASLWWCQASIRMKTTVHLPAPWEQPRPAARRRRGAPGPGWRVASSSRPDNEICCSSAGWMFCTSCVCGALTICRHFSGRVMNETAMALFLRASVFDPPQQ